MNNKFIGIVDIGYGNIRPIMNILKKSYIASILVRSPGDLKNCRKLIIPGVGAFDNFMSGLKKLDLDKAIIDYFHESRPLLGICVGAQVMGEDSEEGDLKGLGIIPMKIKRFNHNLTTGLPIPHMGWNTLTQMKPHYLFDKLSEEHRFYFAHSFYFDVKDDLYALSKTNYGYGFCSIAEYKNAIAIQFHPEKSHEYGFKILQNFSLS
jgi:glutamine amidotransferase